MLERPGRVEFLRKNIALAETYLASARASRNPASDRILITGERITLQTVRLLDGRVQDPNVWQEVHRFADLLEAALDEFTR